MADNLVTALEATKALVAHIDQEYVFDRAAAGGCSGLDFYQSDTFYDLIVAARQAISAVENGLADPGKASADPVSLGAARQSLIAAATALATYIEKERAFDKVSDLGAVGFETYQSEAFIQAIQRVNTAIRALESGLNTSA